MFLDTVVEDRAQVLIAGNVDEDGKFLYAAAWKAAAINVYQRDLRSGRLTHVQEIVDEGSQGDPDPLAVPKALAERAAELTAIVRDALEE